MGYRGRGHIKGVLNANKRKGWLKTRLKMQKGKCGICGEPINGDGTIDHVVPLSRGGEDVFDNTQAAHHKCNNDKGNNLPDDL